MSSYKFENKIICRKARSGIRHLYSNPGSGISSYVNLGKLLNYLGLRNFIFKMWLIMILTSCYYEDIDEIIYARSYVGSGIQ